jgi:division protein CdvB (Snf7/Vps24/ESCRT-III family)
MRYKNNVLDKLVQTEAVVNRIQIQVNRNVQQDQILESIDQLKEAIERVREMISVEPDDLEKQFRG